MGCPDWHTARKSLRLQKYFCGSTARGMAESVGMNGQIDWQEHQISHGRAEVFRGLRNFLNMDRPEHHSTDRLKEKKINEWRKRPTFHLPRSGTICVQLDKQWHCFEGSLA